MNFPEAFIQRIRTNFPNQADRMLEALSGESPVSVRLNKKKNVILTENLEQVLWCDHAFYLPKRPVFTSDPAFHAGAYYVQEASSMFIAHVLNVLNISDKRGLKVLDLCAAPGGKSTLILDHLDSSCTLVSNEVIRNRSAILTENIVKYGHPNCIVTNSDPAEFEKAGELFDLILVDAPCSGEGMFRKDPKSIAEWSEKNVEQCSMRQSRILDHAWNSLKPNGILIYSTCTFEPSENEERVEDLITKHEAESIDIPVNPEWNLTLSERNSAKGYYFLPHKTNGEGFFLSVLRKGESTNERKIQLKEFNVKSPVNTLIDIADGFRLFDTGNEIKLIPDSDFIFFKEYLEKNVLLVHFATTAFSKERNEKVVHADAAFCYAIKNFNLPVITLNYQNALAYLRRESLAGNFSTEKGITLICFENFRLGFAKNIGNRLNNLYPKEWRILSQRLAETETFCRINTQ